MKALNKGTAPRHNVRSVLSNLEKVTFYAHL